MMTHVTTAPERRALVDELLRRKGIRRGAEAGIPRRPQFSPCELSFAQQRLWLMAELKPLSAAYNIPLRLRLRGALDLEAVAFCLQALLARHEALRTSFGVVDGEPRQIVYEAVDIDVPVIDLGRLPASVREHAARRLAREEGRRVFDLSRAPLLRTTVIRLDAGDHVVMLTMHHILSDGWSMSVLARELCLLYVARTARQPLTLPPLPVQYADFAVWQRARLRGDAFERMVTFWKEKLADLPTTQVPTDRPKPARRSGRGSSQTLPLSPVLATDVRNLSRQAGVTVFATFVAALAVWLHRYTGQRDLAVGVPIANRLRSELEGMIGFFVNQIVLRTTVAGHLSFQDVLQHVREVTLDAFAHQDVPFDRIVEEVRPDRDAETNPLFQVACAFHNTPDVSLDVPGLNASPFGTESDATRFDLELHVRDAGGRLGGVLYYDADLFEPATIARRLGHFVTLLEAACADPSRPISELPFLAEAERRQILEWNATERDWRSPTVLDLLDAQVARTPHAPAIVAADGSCTYQELHDLTNRMAHWLRRIGVEPRTLVAIWMGRSRHAIAALLATLKTGAAYVPVDLACPPARLALQLKDAAVSVLLTEQARLGEVPAGAYAVHAIDGAGGPWSAEPASAPAVSVHPESLPYVIYTSGSTGQPKGVMVTHGGLANYLCWARHAYPLGEGSGTLFHSSIAFDLTVTSVLLPLVAGCAIHVVADRDGIDDLTQAFRSSRDLDFVKATPAHLRALAGALPAADLAGRARAFVVGGEALDATLLEFWLTQAPATRVFNEYGPTETVVGCCVQELVAGQTIGEPVPIGRPIANTRLFVVTPHGQLAPVGVPGELWIGGAGVARGYLSQPDATAARFVPDPFSDVKGARLYRSGDAARYRPDGTLEFLGRLDHQVKVRGYRIEPGEIESVLAQHPDVAEAVVTSLRDPERGASLAAYVVARDEYVARQEGAWLDGMSTDHVARWRIVFDDTVGGARAGADPASNFAGWTSSYDGAPIPEPEMRQWVENTVARIGSLRPRSLLEIGCGTGLLLLRLAQTCERYVGTDLSEKALAFVGEQVRRAGSALGVVSLMHQPAHDFSGLEGQTFDAIILNSVVQYFPSIDYLTQVLERAARCLAPGGAIFVGDVRCLPLLDAFHASVQLHRALPSGRCDRLRGLVRSRVAEEEELVVAPAYFRALRAQIPSLTNAAVLLKRDTGANELAKFRYDVIVRAGDEPVAAPARAPLEWHADGLSLERVQAHLETSRPAVLVVRGIPNGRVAADVQALELLNGAERWETVGDLRQRLAARPSAGVSLDGLWALEAACPDYIVDLSWAECDRHGTIAAIFTRKDLDPLAGHRFLAEPEIDSTRRRYASRPIHRTVASQLVPVLNEYLKATLPEYMIPATITVLPAFPLAVSGKVDRDGLPAPHVRRTGRSAADAQPRTPAEEMLAGIWSDVLAVERIGIDENFFELGGHSLLATQVVSRVREAFGVDLPLRALFDAPTVAALAARLSEMASERSPVPPLEPAPRGAGLPLSFAQQRLWFLHRLDPQSTFFNVPLVLRVRGTLSIAAMQRAADTVVERHEALRTTFELEGDQTFQRVAKAGSVPMPIVSLDAVSEAARATLAERLVRREMATPFDLASGPVFRMHVIRLAEDEHVVVVMLHHIVSDAWSIGVLIRELVACYAAYAGGDEPALPRLPVQYADFAVWQRRWLSGPVLDQQLAYWREQLADVIGQGDLFPRRIRKSRPSRRRAYHTAAVSAESTTALKRLSRRHHATLFMTLLAAWDVVLHAETGRTVFVVGTNIANRRDARLELLVGFFINQLVLRADLSGDPSFEALLIRVRAVTLGAYDHQDLPFERLVEALRPARDAGRHPLFQVLFAFENTPGASVTLPGLELQPYPVDRRETTGDLILTMTERPDGLSVLLEFDADLFEDATVARLSNKLLAVIDAIGGDASLPVSALVEGLGRIDRATKRTRRQSYNAALNRSLRQRQPGSSR